MKNLKSYGLDDYLDFGDYKGEKVGEVLIKNRNRINFYFETVDWFLMKEDLILAFGAKAPDLLVPNLSTGQNRYQTEKGLIIEYAVS